jgi:hypothetical protein
VDRESACERLGERPEEQPLPEEPKAKAPREEPSTVNRS